MKHQLAKWCLLLLCVSSAAAIGGGIYEHLIVNPIWSASPPASFTLIQPDTGVPLQRFWMPVHGFITLLIIAALVSTWHERRVRRWLLVGVASYLVMRTWSFLYFIPEMLAFQKVPVESSPTPELLARVDNWTRLTSLREPLDFITFISFLMALYWFARSAAGQPVRARRRAGAAAPLPRAAEPSTSS